MVQICSLISNKSTNVKRASQVFVTNRNMEIKNDFYPFNTRMPTKGRKKGKANDFLMSPKIMKITKFLDKYTAIKDD